MNFVETDRQIFAFSPWALLVALQFCKLSLKGYNLSLVTIFNLHSVNLSEPNFEIIVNPQKLTGILLMLKLCYDV